MTTYILKTGLCGAALALAYVLRLAARLAMLAARDPVMAAALAGPLLIDLTLYATFKSLDFGLLLLLIALWTEPMERLRRTMTYSIQVGLPERS
jgi:hypothetical protein